MKNYKRINNLMGFVCFAVAAFTYCSTIEPTASFWDCPEFITTGYKLEVGHPPGAPFFMLTANLFSQFTNDPSQVACAVNVMSALMSAGCILLLFWSITHLVRNLYLYGSLLTPKGGSLTMANAPTERKLSTANIITIQASGLVGALAYCWSDTFWFSAVEGEVYAYSSLFTALVFWLMLKWEDNADKPGSDRWLIFIAYLTGISVGVHLLNLLCLPALVLIFYYRKVEYTNAWRTLMVLVGSLVLVAIVLYGIVPGIVKVGGWFELLFVNEWHMGYNTGLFFYIILLLATVIWAIVETHRKKSHWRMQFSFIMSIVMVGVPFFYGYELNVIFSAILTTGLLFLGLQLRKTDTGLQLFGTKGKHVFNARAMNTTLLCMLMMIIGYSSYAVIVIRSEANPPMDQNSPEDIFTLGSYLNREQYGSRPLLWGQVYTSDVLREPNGAYLVAVTEDKSPVYQRVEKRSEDEPDSYRLVRYNFDYVYQHNMFFPRMYSSEENHVNFYESWLGGVTGTMENDVVDGRIVGRTKVPTQLENLRFFFTYQCNFMYWRYFMWNFAGRQNDIQGHGEVEHGNWITGFSFIDDARLGDQDLLPSDLRENKGHNVFYCLPLLLGIFGIAWQMMNGRQGLRQLNIVFFLFFMTGLAIVIYLNQTPLQPRERDYAYAGSFYAFAIWIGMGVAAIVAVVQSILKKENKWVTAVVGLGCLGVPLQMVSQTWDDHDRSGRYTCRDFGQNYLQSLSQEGNPIIFTNGDNDTFPLWYNQDVEGVRTDARVCNLSYLQTDWYIDQMRRQAYDSPALPIPYERINYIEGTREYVPIVPGFIESILDNPGFTDAQKRILLGDNPYELRNILNCWVFNNDLPTEWQCIPTDSIVITIDKEAVRRSGMMIASSVNDILGDSTLVTTEANDSIVATADSIPDVMTISLKNRRGIMKNQLMMLIMLAECNWERPLYIASTVGEENYSMLRDYLVQEGLAYRITPFNTTASRKFFDIEKTYDCMMNRFKYGGLDKPGLYIDETIMRMCWTHRRLFGQLALSLYYNNDERALAVAQRAVQEINGDNVPYTVPSGATDLAVVLMTYGDTENGEMILRQAFRNEREYIDYYCTRPRAEVSDREWGARHYYMQDVLSVINAFREHLSPEFMLEVETWLAGIEAVGQGL